MRHKVLDHRAEFSGDTSSGNPPPRCGQQEPSTCSALPWPLPPPPPSPCSLGFSSFPSQVLVSPDTALSKLSLVYAVATAHLPATVSTHPCSVPLSCLCCKLVPGNPQAPCRRPFTSLPSLIYHLSFFPSILVPSTEAAKHEPEMDNHGQLLPRPVPSLPPNSHCLLPRQLQRLP